MSDTYLLTQLLPENHTIGTKLWEVLDLLIDYGCASVENQRGHKDFNASTPQAIEFCWGHDYRNAPELPPDFWPFMVRITVDPSKELADHSGTFIVTTAQKGPGGTVVLEKRYAISLRKLAKLVPHLDDPQIAFKMIDMLDLTDSDDYFFPADEKA